LLEGKKPKTLSALSVAGEKVIASYFPGCKLPALAGFSTIPSGDLRPATLFFLVILMFYRRISRLDRRGDQDKLHSLLYSLPFLVSSKGRDDVEVYERRIPKRLIDRSVSQSQ